MARGAFIAVDGHSTIDQGSAGVSKSKGSHVVRCDLDSIVNWYDLIRPIDPTPEPVPLDAQGQPMHWCSGYLRGGHYSSRAAFNRNRTKASGLQSMCRQCEKELRDYHDATGKK